jgi:hypothetical protein
MNAAGGSGEPDETARTTPARTGLARTGPDQAGPAETLSPGHYEPPRVTYLGTLRELTLGGGSSPDDGVGGAGGVGSQ